MYQSCATIIVDKETLLLMSSVFDQECSVKKQQVVGIHTRVQVHTCTITITSGAAMAQRDQDRNTPPFGGVR